MRSEAGQKFQEAFNKKLTEASSSSEEEKKDEELNDEDVPILSCGNIQKEEQQQDVSGWTSIDTVYYSDNKTPLARYEQKGNKYRLVTTNEDGSLRNPSHDELDKMVAQLNGKKFKLSDTFDAESLLYLQERGASFL